jgi:diadenosine tetraphosphate (Ap4A) HIT family hydrolase
MTLVIPYISAIVVTVKGLIVRGKSQLGRLQEQNCLLCRKYLSRIFETKYYYAMFDDFPVRHGHILVVPIRHVSRLSELSQREFSELFSALTRSYALIERDFGADAFNIGLNDGEAAGQTIPHLHFHVIPRKYQDVAEPRGGIRKFLPNPLTEYPPRS